MADSLVRDALRIIQDIVTAAKGSPLSRDDVRRVEEVLARLAAADFSAPAEPAYSRRAATVLFADLRGFSTIASSYPPDVVMGVLSRCFGRMAEIVLRHYGTIDKFMGDAIMAVFYGEHASPRDHAQRAALCALDMQLAMAELARQHREEALPQIYIGVGVNTGSVLAGLIGSDAYRAYTVIGEDVNLAARIEAFSLRGQVLISETTYAHCSDFVQASEPMDVHVKGKVGSIRIREALAIPELGKVVPRQDQRKSPRVEVDLRLAHWRVANKIVASARLEGSIRELSYHGALVETAQPLGRYSEIKLAFDLPGLDFRAEEIYARVVSVREKDGRHLAGVEFTSLNEQTAQQIQLYVQMCIQGERR